MSFLSRVSAAALLILLPFASHAASCSDTGGQYEAWKGEMAAEAQAEGVGQRGIAALMATSYSKATIGADRNQKSFKYSLEKFLNVRGADTIISQGRSRKAKNPDFYASLEAAYGVPAGVIIAIHGMETGFGGFMGDTNVVSAIATLTYDCRRSDFFRPHLIGALKMVDKGMISPNTVGAKHGEFVTDEICDRFCVLGTPEQALAKLRELESVGVDQFNIYLMTHGQEATLAAYGREILPAFNGTAV